MLTETHLTEGRIYHALENIPKGKYIRIPYVRIPYVRIPCVLIPYICIYTRIFNMHSYV